MSVAIAAIMSGTDPVGKLPESAFHGWLEEPLICPKCSVQYNLVCDYTASVGRFFAEESRRPIQMLRKAIFQGHFDGHRVTHFESSGVVVVSFTPPPALTHLVQ